MGKFSTRSGPLVETVDRRGDSFNRGLGDAPVSTAKAAVDGAISGAISGANLTAKILDTKNRYNPRRLEAEISGLEIGNDSVRESIRGAALQNDLVEKYGDREASANVRLQENKAEVAEKTGLRNANSIISSRNATTANTHERTKTARFNNSAEQRALRTRIAEAKATQGEFNSRPEVLAEEFRRQQLANKTTEEALFKTAEINAGLGNQNAQALAKQAASAIKAQDSEWRDKMAHYERLSKSEVATPEDVARAKKHATEAGKKTDDLRNASIAQQNYMRNNATETQRAQLAQSNAQNLVEGTRVATEARRSVAANKLMDMATQASADNPTGVDGPNIAAGAGVLDAQVNLMKKARSETEKKMLAGQIDATIEMFGGKEAFDEYLQSDKLSAEDKKAMTKTVAKAAIATGKTEYLSQGQKDLLQSGAGTKVIEDPEEATNQIASALSGGEFNLPNGDLKKSLTGNAYFKDAQTVIGDGTGKITRRSVAVSGGQGPTGADIAGQSAGVEVSKMIYINEKTGQQSAGVPQPREDGDHSRMNVIDDALKAHNEKAEQAQAAQQSSNVIDQNNQEAVAQPVPEAVPAQEQSTPESPQAQEAKNTFLGGLELPGEPSEELARFGDRIVQSALDGEFDPDSTFSRDKISLGKAVNAYVKQSFEALSEEDKELLQGETKNNQSAEQLFGEIGGLKQRAESTIRKAAQDMTNTVRIKKHIEREELVQSGQNETNAIKQFALEKRLEKFDRDNRGVAITNAQAAAIKQNSQLQLEQYALENGGKTPDTATLNKIKMDSMRAVFNEASPQVRSLLDNDE